METLFQNVQNVCVCVCVCARLPQVRQNTEQSLKTYLP